MMTSKFATMTLTESKAFAQLRAMLTKGYETAFDMATLIKRVMNDYDYSLRKVADKLGKSVGTLSDLMKAYDELVNREYIERLESKDFDYTKISRYLRAISKEIYTEEEHSFDDMLSATQAVVKSWEKVDKEDDKDESDFVTIYNKDGNVLGQISQKILDKFLKEA